MIITHARASGAKGISARLILSQAPCLSLYFSNPEGQPPFRTNVIFIIAG
jgi:hypothetical protein